MATATRVLGDDESDGNSNEGGRQATAMLTVVGEDGGGGNGNEDEGQQKG
jgi:hypothetical protein